MAGPPRSTWGVLQPKRFGWWRASVRVDDVYWTAGSRCGVGFGDRRAQEVPGHLQAGQAYVARPEPIAVHQAGPHVLVATATRFDHQRRERRGVGAHHFP